MKKFAVILSLVVGSWIIIPTPQAHASWLGDAISWLTGGHNSDSGRGGNNGWRGKNGNNGSKGKNGNNGWRGKKASNGKKTGVPELDPSAAGGAMILLLGGVAYIASRRREEDVI